MHAGRLSQPTSREAGDDLEGKVLRVPIPQQSGFQPTVEPTGFQPVCGSVEMFSFINLIVSYVSGIAPAPATRDASGRAVPPGQEAVRARVSGPVASRPIPGKHARIRGRAAGNPRPPAERTSGR